MQGEREARAKKNENALYGNRKGNQIHKCIHVWIMINIVIINRGVITGKGGKENFFTKWNESGWNSLIKTCILQIASSREWTSVHGRQQKP